MIEPNTSPRYERRRRKRNDYLEEMRLKRMKDLRDEPRSTNFGRCKRASVEMLDLVDLVADRKGLHPNTVRAVFDAIFGSMTRGERGVIQEKVDRGELVVIPGFGTFGDRSRKGTIRTDVITPGGFLLTPNNSTPSFKPAKEWYWEHYRITMTANLPDHPLPPNVRVSQRLYKTRGYRLWEAQWANTDIQMRPFHHGDRLADCILNPSALPPKE